jgi:FkbM family methyltransferase
MLFKLYEKLRASVRSHSSAFLRKSKIFRSIIDSQEPRPAALGSPFYCYNSMIDAEEIIRRHAQANLTPTPGYQTNFLGVLIDPRFFPAGLENTAGTVEPIPIPANWHADLAEWAAVLRAVDLSNGTFRMAELGCGWGCWMNNAGVAAKRAGRKVQVVGVEGDVDHVAFGTDACRVNGLVGDEVRVIHGIAAATAGTALFPRQDIGGHNYGLKPVFGATEKQRTQYLESGKYDELPMVGLDRVIGAEDKLDLLHIDIQGGEADLIASCLPILMRQVRYMVVGTHSREIEGQIFETMRSAAWRLEIERPAILSLSLSGPNVTVDGVQGWRNTSLLP